MKREEGKNEKGFSLVEVLISLGIIMLVSTGIFHSILTNLKHTRDTFYRTQAVQAAQEYLDTLRMQDPVSIPSSGTNSTTIAIDGRQYQVEASFCENPSYCGLNTRHIELEVSYRGQKHFYVETVYTKLK